MKNNEPVKIDSLLLSSENTAGSDSIKICNIKSLLILPVVGSFFPYIDSGTKESFSQPDYEVLKTLGELLGDTINLAGKNESKAGGITVSMFLKLSSLRCGKEKKTSKTWFLRKKNT